MSKPITLSSPRYRIVLGDPESPDTWQQLEVQSITPDMARAEGLFVRHKWGKPLDQPIKLMTITAWAALVRTKQIEGAVDAFEAQLIDIGEAGIDQVGPTQPELEAG